MILFKQRKKWICGLSFLVISLLLAIGVEPSVALSKKSLSRNNSEGAVTIAVTYLNPLQPQQEGVLAFEVKLNTHSVDLDQYRFDQIAFLQVDAEPEQKSLGWFEPSGGGHHLSGVLKFNGSFSTSAERMTLVIRGVDGVAQRFFEWQQPLQ